MGNAHVFEEKAICLPVMHKKREPLELPPPTHLPLFSLPEKERAGLCQSHKRGQNMAIGLERAAQS